MPNESLDRPFDLKSARTVFETESMLDRDRWRFYARGKGGDFQFDPPVIYVILQTF